MILNKRISNRCKIKGYKENTLKYYTKDSDNIHHFINDGSTIKIPNFKCFAVDKDKVLEWLWNNHKIHIEVSLLIDFLYNANQNRNIFNGSNKMFYFNIIIYVGDRNISSPRFLSNNTFDASSEAWEAAIYKALSMI